MPGNRQPVTRHPPFLRGFLISVFIPAAHTVKARIYKDDVRFIAFPVL